jgi:hypothetical protein
MSNERLCESLKIAKIKKATLNSEKSIISWSIVIWSSWSSSRVMTSSTFFSVVALCIRMMIASFVSEFRATCRYNRATMSSIVALSRVQSSTFDESTIMTFSTKINWVIDSVSVEISAILTAFWWVWIKKKVYKNDCTTINTNVVFLVVVDSVTSLISLRSFFT